VGARAATRKRLSTELGKKGIRENISWMKGQQQFFRDINLLEVMNKLIVEAMEYVLSDQCMDVHKGGGSTYRYQAEEIKAAVGRGVEGRAGRTAKCKWLDE